MALHDIREAQRARGTASILAIGTATPPNCYYQSEFPDFYFRATKSDHMIDLKHKFKRICVNSGIKKRHMLLTEEMLIKNPGLYNPDEAPSLNLRQEMVIGEIPRLGKAAAQEAIKEWGRPVSEITHLVFATSSNRLECPGADFHLARLLGLSPSVRRHIIYQQACSAGGAALRLSKDLAENNAGARVLVVCAETIAYSFRAPSTSNMSMLIGHAIIGDGAAAAIIGATEETERPLFRMVSAMQTFFPDTEDVIVEELNESGTFYWLSRDIPSHVGGGVGKVMEDAFAPFGISDWNSLFYAMHPGGRAVLDRVEEKLGLGAEKLRASRHVLCEFGNMRAPTVLFALDEVRKNPTAEWGVLLAFGPGITVETIVLQREVSAACISEVQT